jgi:hypothetical protein
VQYERVGRRNKRESTRTERKKPGRQDTQRWPSGEMPPPGTIMWTCGWTFIAFRLISHGRGAPANLFGESDQPAIVKTLASTICCSRM